MTKRLLLAAGLLLAAAPFVRAQSLDDLNIQFHGYATQGFLYTNQNNWNTTDSSSGSAAWNETVVNLSAQPESHLRVGIQARYFLLGSLGNQITLDWAQADYKVSDRFGVRFGKVKTPLGLYNESQDIDPAHLWVLLPQSMYPLASRNSLLAHYGGVAYGSLPLGERMGKLQYRGFAGERVIASDDGYLQGLRDAGVTTPNGISGKTFGGTLRWETPVRGLVAGVSEVSGGLSGAASYGPYNGTIGIKQFRQTFYSAKYENRRLTVASEFSRVLVQDDLTLIGGPVVTLLTDQRPYYVMASYKATGKLSGGLYYSADVDHRAAFTSGRYQKDWALAGRYDFNSFLYAKVEQHWIDGTLRGFSASDNPNLQPATKMTLVKLGVSF